MAVTASQWGDDPDFEAVIGWLFELQNRLRSYADGHLRNLNGNPLAGYDFDDEAQLATDLALAVDTLNARAGQRKRAHGVYAAAILAALGTVVVDDGHGITATELAVRAHEVLGPTGVELAALHRASPTLFDVALTDLVRRELVCRQQHRRGARDHSPRPFTYRIGEKGRIEFERLAREASRGRGPIGGGDAS